MEELAGEDTVVTLSELVEVCRFPGLKVETWGTQFVR
jgi:hypothetical protein